MIRRALVGAAFVSVALLGAACSSSSSTASPSAATGTTSATGSSDTADVSGQPTFAMSAVDYSFSPSTLTGTAGQKLTITVRNDGTATHTFTIDSQHVDVEIPPGQSEDVTVTFPQSGSVEFHCRFHVSLGMTGKLEVA
jgi:plastocyanin